MNKKGESQFVFTLLVSSTLLMIYLYFQFSQLSIRKMQERIDTYLCFKKYKNELSSLTNTIAKTNLAIVPLVPLSLVPASAKMARLTIKNLQIAQDLKLKNFQANLASSTYCHLSIRGILISAHPYQTHTSLRIYRDHTEIAQLGKKEWALNLFGKKSLTPMLRLKMQHQSALSLETAIDAAELATWATAP